jgi:replication factor A1
VDAIGVVSEVSESITLPTRYGGVAMKRGIVLVDAAGHYLEVAFWGPEGAALKIKIGDILALKNGKVKEYQGKNISVLSSTKYEINPEENETAKTLRQWYKEHADNLPQSHKYRKESLRDCRTFEESEIELEKLEVKEFSFKAMGTIIAFEIGEKEPLVYKAAPDTGLKVVQEGDKWVSEKNNKRKVYGTYQPRYIVRAWVADISGARKVTIFKEMSSILGREASVHTIEELKEKNDIAEIKRIFDHGIGKNFAFTYSICEEEHENGVSIHYTVKKLSAINYSEESRRLLQEIEKEKSA